MAKKPLPDADLLRQLLEYSPETGGLTWKARTPDMFEDGFRTAEGNCNLWNSRYANMPALTCVTSGGYRSGHINRKLFLAHRIIWKMVHGEDPDTVDHINGDTEDNRLSNLRSVTFTENARNRKLRDDSPNGAAGVYYTGYKFRPWEVRISNRQVGCYATFDEAVSARKVAEKQLGYRQR